jgi:flagellin FlaB
MTVGTGVSVGGDDRGQVGIGILVMFVGMIIVSAIAAGVIVNMAGMLGTRAEQAGDDAVGQLTGGIQVQDLTCTVSDEENGIEEAWAHVRVRPGGSAVNVSNATILYTDRQVHRELSYTNASANATQYTVTDDGEQIEVLANTTRMARLTLDVSAIRADALDSDAAPLTNGEEATVTVSTPQGAVTKVRVRATGIAGTDRYTAC